MIEWLIALLEEAKLTEFSGRLRIDFRHGRPQNVLRTAGVFVTANQPPLCEDPVMLLDKWIHGGQSGFVDIVILVGAVVEVQPADLLFPPKPVSADRYCPACPRGQKLAAGPDYGNVLVCPRCGWQGTAMELNRLAVKVMANRG
jgi:hypothetical protein